MIVIQAAFWIQTIHAICLFLIETILIQLMVLLILYQALLVPELHTTGLQRVPLSYRSGPQLPLTKFQSTFFDHILLLLNILLLLFKYYLLSYPEVFVLSTQVVDFLHLIFCIAIHLFEKRHIVHHTDPRNPEVLLYFHPLLCRGHLVRNRIPHIPLDQVAILNNVFFLFERIYCSQMIGIVLVNLINAPHTLSESFAFQLISVVFFRG